MMSNFSSKTCLAAAVILLVGGSCVRQDAAVPAALETRVLSVRGMALVDRGDGNTLVPCPYMVLATNDLIRTFPDSALDLFVEPQGLVKLHGETVLKVGSLTMRTGGVTRLDLIKGKIFCLLNKLAKGSEFEVHSGTAILGVRGTSFTVERGELTGVYVLTGKVLVADSENRVPPIEVAELKQVRFSSTNPEKFVVAPLTVTGFTDMIQQAAIADNIECQSELKAAQTEVQAVRKTWQKLERQRSAALKKKSVLRPTSPSALPEPSQVTNQERIKW